MLVISKRVIKRWDEYNEEIVGPFIIRLEEHLAEIYRNIIYRYGGRLCF